MRIKTLEKLLKFQGCNEFQSFIDEVLEVPGNGKSCNFVG